jgi:prolyl-tRNA editing enzyme YbaK/EbsC (Cys-tRNA(Pro) deacylase)
MEYGGITPVGLPPQWRLLVDSALTAEDVVCIGSGLRRSKLLIPGPVLAHLHGAQVIEGLGR